MANGDIISATIRSDGWSMDVIVEGITPTGVTYDYGITANVPGTLKVALTAVSLGFDATGAATTHSRSIYGTKTVRKAYPSNATLDETDNGNGTTTIRVALSEPVFAKDKSGVGNSGTDVSVTFLASWASKGGVSSAATTLTATNSSTRAYPKIACKRVWFNYEKIRASSYYFECLPVGWYINQGRPFACVTLSAEDESANAVTATVTQWGLSARSNAVSVVTCNHTISLSTLDKHERVTVNFQAYPWIGDSSSVVNTVGESDRDPELTGPVIFFNDKDADYPAAIAYVDNINGFDSGGTIGLAKAIGDEAAAKARPFKTIINAREALVAFNLANYGRQDLNGSIIYLMASTTHQWVGDGTTNAQSGTKVVRNTDKCELLITRDPAAALTDVKVIQRSAFGIAQNQIKTQNYRVHGVVLKENNAGERLMAGTGSSDDVCVLDSILAESAGVSSFLTRQHKCSMRINLDAAGSSNATLTADTGTPNERVMLTRGCGGIYTSQSHMHTVVGNNLTSGEFDIGVGYSNVFVWMNRVELNTSDLLLDLAPTAGTVDRLVVVGNCFVAWGNTAVLPYSIGGEGTAASPITNANIAYNSFLGANGSDFSAGRVNLFYNQSSDTTEKTGWVRANYFRNLNHKNDVFGTNGTYINNWWQTYGVGNSGNVASESSVDNSEFDGFYTKKSNTNSLTIDFANPTDTSAGGAGGDYTPGDSSELLNKSVAALAFMPIDLNGNRRATDGTGAAGAYANVNEAPATGGSYQNLLLLSVG